MSPLRWLVFGLFFPACLILLGQVIWSPAIADRLLALALLLLCIDQSRAGVLDLEQALMAQEQTPDPRLDRFYRITICAIAVALVGFYGAWLSLSFGAIVIFCGQLGFHCTAGIRLETAAEGMVIFPWGVKERWSILVANTVGLVFLSLWMQAIAPLWMASLILSMVLAYGAIKYLTPSDS